MKTASSLLIWKRAVENKVLVSNTKKSLTEDFRV